MIDVAAGIVAFVTSLALALCMPSMGKCPTGWWLGEGVKRSGSDIGQYTCLSPSPRCCGEPDTECGAMCPTEKRVTGRIYCTGGALPIIVDEHTVGCQR